MVLFFIAYGFSKYSNIWYYNNNKLKYTFLNEFKQGKVTAINNNNNNKHEIMSINA